MGTVKTILSRFKALSYTWWYKVSSLGLNGQIEHLMCQIAVFITAIIFTACGNTKLVPIEAETKHTVEIRDSIVYKDSLIYIPRERIVEVVPQIDTLFMNIEVASATAYLDTNLMLLKGTLESNNVIQREYIERVKYTYKIDTFYLAKPQPYEVVKTKTPKWAYYTLAFTILVLIWNILKIKI